MVVVGRRVAAAERLRDDADSTGELVLLLERGERAYLRRPRARPTWARWWRRPSGRRASKRPSDADALPLR